MPGQRTLWEALCVRMRGSEGPPIQNESERANGVRSCAPRGGGGGDSYNLERRGSSRATARRESRFKATGTQGRALISQLRTSKVARAEAKMC